jgi:hypothetical protein
MRTFDYLDNGGRRELRRSPPDTEAVAPAGPIHTGRLKGRERMTPEMVIERRAQRQREQKIERERAEKRAAFEEHHQLTRETGVLHDVAQKVRATAKRLAGHATKRKGKTAAERRLPAQRELRRAMDAAPNAGDNHVLLPVAAVNKAAMATELAAISMHVQGHVLTIKGGVASYGQGPHGAVFTISAEQKARLIAMHGYVRKRLPLDLLRMSDIVVTQALNVGHGNAPTVAQIGAAITSSDDARVQKGGVIGYYRALFQTIASLQKEWLIDDAVKLVKVRKQAGAA